MAASPGRATGEIVFHSKDAVLRASTGKSVILVRVEASAEDVPGMQAASGIVITRGGLTSDAAVVARSLGKPCIADCARIAIDYAADTLTVWGPSRSKGSDLVLKVGDVITIDGDLGEIWLG